MSNRPEQLIRLGDDMTESANVTGFRIMQEGVSKITGLMLTVGAPSLVDAIFQMNINDSPHFADIDRPKIVAGDSAVMISGLSINVSQFYKVAFDLQEGEAKTPIEVGVKFEDNTPGAIPVGGATGEILAKTSGADYAAAWEKIPHSLGFAASDETTALVIADGVVIIPVDKDFRLTDVWANVNIVSSSGLPQIRIKKNGTTIFSTNITIDATEHNSLTAATPYVLAADPTDFVKGDLIQVDIIAAGTGAKGLKIWLAGVLL